MTASVVVGIDGSPGADAALRFALEEATLRKLALRIVCAWEASAAAQVGDTFVPTPDAFVEAEHHAEDLLRTALAQVAPGGAVQAEALSVEGDPATVLIERARDAVLLVVGSRGRGTATSLLLGSVSQRLAHHAPCPLLIVPHPAE